MLSKEIREVLEKHKASLAHFEEYDRTGVWPLEKRRVDVTLTQETVRKIDGLAKKHGVSRSRMIEKLVENF